MLTKVQMCVPALTPQALKQQGVQQYNPEGQKFDPNYHSALFEMVDPSKEPGQIGAVTKVSCGFAEMSCERPKEDGCEQARFR